MKYPEMSPELEKEIDECNLMLKKIEAYVKIYPFVDLTKYLTEYAVIKTCGTLESVFHSIVIDYFGDLLNDDKITNYLEKTVRRECREPSYQNMVSLLERFDKNSDKNGWGATYKKKCDSLSDGQRLMSSSASLVADRNCVAHGMAISTSFDGVKGYYRDTECLLRVFFSVVHNGGTVSRKR